MPLHIQCETPEATLLLAVKSPDGVLRFPNDETQWPGLSLKVNILLNINSQLMERSRQEFNDPTLRIDIWQDYSAQIFDSTGAAVTTLYVAKYSPSDEVQAKLPFQKWETLPALIRSLPKDRNRLAYLKAWQVLSGGLEENTKALDVDEVSRYLKSLEKQ